MGQNLFKYKHRDIDAETLTTHFSTRELQYLSSALTSHIEVTKQKIDKAWGDSTDGSFGAACDYELTPLRTLKGTIDDLIELKDNQFYNNSDNIREDYDGE